MLPIIIGDVAAFADATGDCQANASGQIRQGGAENAQNLSTEKASEKKGAWLQKENENC